ncbi:MAG: hypothetical protein WC443_04550 [Desulfobaccales bacterium]
MCANPEERPLKVCSTCRHWTYKYKGLCTRLNQGVGKFWTCEEWTAAAGHPAPEGPETSAAGPPSA